MIADMKGGYPALVAAAIPPWVESGSTPPRISHNSCYALFLPSKSALFPHFAAGFDLDLALFPHFAPTPHSGKVSFADTVSTGRMVSARSPLVGVSPPCHGSAVGLIRSRHSRSGGGVVSSPGLTSSGGLLCGVNSHQPSRIKPP